MSLGSFMTPPEPSAPRLIFAEGELRLQTMRGKEIHRPDAPWGQQSFNLMCRHKEKGLPSSTCAIFNLSCFETLKSSSHFVLFTKKLTRNFAFPELNQYFIYQYFLISAEMGSISHTRKDTNCIMNQC